MNRVLLAVLLCLPAALSAQAPEQLFAEGNQAYQQGDLGKAIGLYESILHNGYVAGDLYYNLGNAYYRSGNIARAILNYERARRLMPDDEDLRHNLQLAGTMITDKIEPAPRLFLWDWWQGLKDSFSLLTITWICYGCFVLFLGAFCVVLLGRTYLLRTAGLWCAGVAVLLLACTLLLMYVRVAELHRTDEAVVMTGVVTVKNSPDEKSSDAFVLHAGIRVQLIDRVGSWVKIHIADGKVGWIQENGVERI
jgi:tetratricopeptide (TPR) repeat protein